jgi:hypothetical protein
MTLNGLLKEVIVGASLLVLGVVAFLAYLNVKLAIKKQGFERRLNAAYALARVGFVIVTALVAEAVLRAPDLAPSWRVIGYTVGIIMTAVGYVGVAIESRKAPQRVGDVVAEVPRTERGPRDPRDKRDVRRENDPRDPRDARAMGDPADPKEPQ